jgi:hypothetical protein
MYPGLNDTNSQVAKFQHRQMVAEGQYQQYVASMMTATSRPRMVSTAIRHRLGTLFVRASQHFPRAQPAARERCASTPSGELGAVA